MGPRTLGPWAHGPKDPYGPMGPKNDQKLRLRNYQGLDWGRIFKKFEGLARLGEFLIIRGGVWVEDLHFLFDAT